MTCFRCNRPGNFSSQCLSNTIATISVTTEQPLNEQVLQYEDVKYLDTVENTNGNMWELQVRIGQNLIKFKVDTGAEVTVLFEATWNSLNQIEPLQPPDTTLCGPDRTRLTVLGKISLTLTHEGSCCTQPVYVVKNITKDFQPSRL